MAEQLDKDFKDKDDINNYLKVNDVLLIFDNFDSLFE